MGVRVTFREARAELEAAGRPHTGKLMTAAEAVSLVADGDHVAIGGTMYSRTPMALLFALLRQRRRHLALSRPLAGYEVELFLATGAADRIVTSWVGMGMRWGLAPILRHCVESGSAAFEEWSHLAMGLRYKAAAMGVPFLPGLSMLGSDLADEVGLKTVTCPYTGQRLAALPALNPDVALVHVHRADRYGNAQVDGYRHMDADMARAARKVIVSAERIVSADEISARPGATMLPHFAVDAVVEAPYGAYPHECYGGYEADLDHIGGYIESIRTHGVAGGRRYVAEHVDGNADFTAFLDTVGPQRLAAQVAAAERLMPR
jgi:glutaconate CoA-transferase subunit A